MYVGSREYKLNSMFLFITVLLNLNNDHNIPYISSPSNVYIILLSWCTDAYVECASICVCRGVQAACYFVRMCNSHSEILQDLSETLRKIGVNWSKHPKRVVRKALFSMRIWSRCYEHPVHTV